MGSEGRGDGGSEEKSSMGWGGNGLVYVQVMGLHS